MTSIDLSNRKESAKFYETRYAHGYMGFWSAFEKERLLNLIQELKLPTTGKALDFGCGRGIFTAVLKQALPHWEIYGCDISTEAISSAIKNTEGIRFFVLGDKSFSELRFDFIHSHHVLEHVFDEKITASEMCTFAKKNCTMLHSFPCDNSGSLEYKISSLRKNGIDRGTGKFFFEDKAHMRRMNLAQAAAPFRQEGFYILNEYYANQYFGALKWIAESNFRLLLYIANPFAAINFSGFLFLIQMLAKLKFYWFCFFVSSAFESADRGQFYMLKRFLQTIAFIFFFWFAIPVRSWLWMQAKQEWELMRKEKNGSELFLTLRRE